jgi:type I restriction enzyme S subunit
MKLKPYPEYKDSGVEWLGNVPLNWNINRLRFVLRNGIDGIKIGPFGSMLKSDELVDEGFKVYGQENVINTDFHRGNRFISKKKFKELIKYQIFTDDLIVTMMGTAGNAQLVPNNIQGGVMDSHLIRLRFNEKVIPKFIEILINTSDYIKGEVKYFSKGAIMDGLNSELIKGLIISIPPKEEQKQIIHFLDKKTLEIDMTIEKDTRLIELLKEKRTALINHVVTKGLDPTVKMKDSGVEWIGRIPDDWEVNRLKFLTAKKAQYGANEEPEYNENKFDYRYVRITDVNDNGGLKKDSYAYLSKENARGFVLEEGDVLFARSGATVGKVYYYSQDDGNCCFAGYMIRYVTNNELLEPQFLLYYSLSKSYKEWIKVVSTQSTIENVSAEKYDELNIPTPKLSQQRQIVKFLDNEIPKIDEIILKIEEKISFLKEYKKSLIHHVVTGKVDVREVAV